MTFVYASIGPALTCYGLDVPAATLARRSTVTLPANVQYAWPHHSGRLLYVASSDGVAGLGIAGKAHHLSAFSIGPSGALAPHGAPVALPGRPIHVGGDEDSSHILVAYNSPPAIRVYGVAGDGSLGGEVAQAATIDPGIFPHQIRVFPGGGHAILVSRGHDATAERAEQPGSLNLFTYVNGQLAGQQVVAPGGGFGFGPRHVDFHPERPWVYVSLERQNRLAMFARTADGLLEGAPRFQLTTLAGGPVRAHQMASAIRVHPGGHVVYVANRAPDMRGVGNPARFGGGDNTIAVYALDPASGEPRCVQNIDSAGIHCRHLHIDPTGTIMAASHIAGVTVTDGATERYVPAGISLFRIAADGRLSFASRFMEEKAEALLFWMGMVATAPPGPLH